MYLFLGILIIVMIAAKFIIRPHFKQKTPDNKISRSVNNEITHLLNNNDFKMISHSNFKIKLEGFFQIATDSFFYSNPLFTAIKDDEKYISVDDDILKDENLVDFIKIALSEYVSIESMGLAGKIGLNLYSFKALFYFIASYMFIINTKISSVLMVAVVPSAIRLLFGILAIKGNSEKLFNKNNSFIYIIFRIIDVILYPLIFMVMYGYKAKLLAQITVLLILINSIRELSVRAFKVKQVGITYIYTLF